MTITKALAELKLLAKKISRATNESFFVDCYQRKYSKTIFTKKDIKEYEEEVKSNYQSVVDLIEQRNKIKNAIIQSNSKTKIKIGKNTMTVIQAIERKQSIVFEKDLLSKMRRDLASVKTNMQENNTNIDNSIMEMLKANLGKDRIANKDDYDKIANPIREDNEVVIIDPLKLEKLILKLEQEIEEFENEVDFSLSESNAKTEINV